MGRNFGVVKICGIYQGLKGQVQHFLSGLPTYYKDKI